MPVTTDSPHHHANQEASITTPVVSGAFWFLGILFHPPPKYPVFTRDTAMSRVFYIYRITPYNLNQGVSMC
jgi:hypothetical protein